LNEILQPLESNEPAKLTLVIRDLVETIKSIHESAKYYGSKDNITTLMVKITNQIIKACRIWIETISSEYVVPVADPDSKQAKPHKLYDRNSKDILHRIGECITLNSTY